MPDDVAECIRRHQRSHAEATFDDGRCDQPTGHGVVPAPPLGHGGAGTYTNRTNRTDGRIASSARKRRQGRRGGGCALGGPRTHLWGSDGQVEQRHGGDDRHHSPGGDKPAAGLAEGRHHAVDGRQPEGGSAGQHDGVEPGNGGGGGEYVELAGGGCPTPYLGRRGRPLGKNDDGDPGASLGIGPVAHRHPGEVAQGRHGDPAKSGLAGRSSLGLGSNLLAWSVRSGGRGSRRRHRLVRWSSG